MVWHIIWGILKICADYNHLNMLFSVLQEKLEYPRNIARDNVISQMKKLNVSYTTAAS